MFMAVPLAQGAGTGGSSTPSAPSSAPASEPRDPAVEARRLYNEGVKWVERADKPGADAKKSRKDYSGALKRFEDAVGLDAANAEAWNYVGYCRRKLGDFGGALGAYDEALRLKPGFPEALEYRGHAFLGMGKIDEAKRDYLDLFARNRQLAAQLLAGFKTWTASQRTAATNDPAALAALDAWVAEREQLAQQTAALTRAGSAAGWR
jgi:tetratricopeptide (TPR) repeat protein